MRRFFSLAALFTLASLASAAEPNIEFNRDVRPILSDSCFSCHGPDAKARKAKLRLDVEKIAKAPANSGSTAIVPNDAKASEVLNRVLAKNDDESHMPPKGSGKKITPEQIETLKKWIEQGAKWEDHWAFTPIKTLALPDTGKQTNAVDVFIRSRLISKKMTPAPEADRDTLIRRLSFDLTGLPPTPKAVEAFLADRDASAYEKLVDTLLASPQYGERMAMFWLDLARYADSVGYHGDQAVSVWPYRDWVVKAFNDNKKFDEFTREQLAGDLLPNPTTVQKVASGYNRLGMMSAEGGVQPKEYLAKYASERVRAVGGAWLGLTTGCAECHDHKFDPITAKDFYKLEAFFADIQEQGLYDGNNFGSKISLPNTEQAKKLAEMESTALAQEKPLPGAKALLGLAGTFERDRTAKASRQAVDAIRNSIPTTLVTATVPPRPIRVLNRGNWMDEKGEIVEPGTPGFLPNGMKKEGRLTRLDLANWLVAKENPLTARVLANRLWKLMFGNGLARKIDDLGSQGEAPTHPELLDYLANDLRSDWNLKRFLKSLAMSETYRQASITTPMQRELDPNNLEYARQSRWRLDAEMVRDASLSAAGLLNDELGGPPAKPYQPRGYWSFLNFPAREWQDDTGDKLYRRGLYTHWQRQYLHPTLLAFDAPSREECTADRVRSNTPLQSLVLLNAPEFVEAARMMAEKVLTEKAVDDGDRIDSLYRRVLSRTAKPAEKEAIRELLSKLRSEFQANPKSAAEFLGTGSKVASKDLDPVELAAWANAARVVFNLHAAITRN